MRMLIVCANLLRIIEKNEKNAMFLQKFSKTGTKKQILSFEISNFVAIIAR